MLITFLMPVNYTVGPSLDKAAYGVRVARPTPINASICVAATLGFAVIGPSERLIRRLTVGTPLGAADIDAVAHLPMMVKDHPPQAAIVREGERPGQCCLLIDGFACRSKTTDVGKRQILSIHILGDIPDLQSLHLHIMDHDLTTLSACKVGFLAHEVLL